MSDFKRGHKQHETAHPTKKSRKETRRDARQTHFGVPRSPPPPSPSLPSETPGTAGMRPVATAAEDAHQSRLLYELCALLLTVLRASPEDGAGAGPRPLLPRQVTPAGVASMLLGASMALMLCGSVTFMLGFFLMPWVVGLGCVFLFVGFVTNLSGIWRAILLWPAAACSASPKEASSSPWHIFSKPPFMPM
uniref:Uncharacterized protein n=1 Tax=Setaria italica TaxID=4555 RepID=K3ZX61_SETIT